MKVLDRVGKEVNKGDFVIYVVKGDRHPVLEFGWVLDFNQSKGRYARQTERVIIQRAKKDGTRLNNTVVDTPGHWRDETPEHVKNPWHSNPTPGQSYYSRTQEDWDDYWVEQTLRDTGKPSTTRLEVFDGENSRLLVAEPYV